MSEPCKHSARTYIGGGKTGHADSLAEARRLAVEEVERREAELADAFEEERETFDDRRRAIAANEHAVKARQAVQSALYAARHTLHYRMGQSDRTCIPPFPERTDI